MFGTSLADRMIERRTGVIHGRFQVLHNDHLAYLIAGHSECEHLVVGITNPDCREALAEDVDPDRSRADANPLTYYERMIMVKCALYDCGLHEADFSVTPLPISFPEQYWQYVPQNALYLLTIYDDWGRRKLEYFQSQGLRTYVLWEISEDCKGLSAARVRQAMAQGEPWEHLVPKSTALLCKAWRVPQRLQQLAEHK